jgi:hypothetical protein
MRRSLQGAAVFRVTGLNRHPLTWVSAYEELALRPGDERRHKPKGRAGCAALRSGGRFRRMAQLSGALRAGVNEARPLQSFPRGGGR